MSDHKGLSLSTNYCIPIGRGVLSKRNCRYISFCQLAARSLCSVVSSHHMGDASRYKRRKRKALFASMLELMSHKQSVVVEILLSSNVGSLKDEWGTASRAKLRSS